MKKVYIAGKLNDDAVGYIKNLHAMIQEAEKVRKAGFSVYIPGLDFLGGLVFGDWDYHCYFNNSQPWLLASDAVYVCPNSERSTGTQKEIKLAKKNGIPVVDTLGKLCSILSNGKEEK